MTERIEDPLGPPKKGSRSTTVRFALIIAAALILGVVAGLAGVYGIMGDGRNVVATGPASVVPGEATKVIGAADQQCRKAGETARRIAPLATGELAAFAPTLKPTRIPDLAFLNPEGQPVKLSTTGAGGLRLVNIWATWCVPCRKEMPALDELQAQLGGKDFEVVAINIDTRDPAKPKTFMSETGIKHLALYTDPKAQAFQDLRTVGRGFGLPTTMLVDGQGCEIGHISGPAEWASPDAIKMLKAALEG